MQHFLRILLPLPLLLLPLAALADGLAASATRLPDGAVRLSVAPPPDAHISADSFTVSLPGDPTPFPIDLPPPDLQDPAPAWTRPLDLAVPAPADAKVLHIRYQLCTDTTCLFPQSLLVPLDDDRTRDPADDRHNAPASPAYLSLDGYATPDELLAFLAPVLPDAAPADDSAASAPSASPLRRFLAAPADFLRTRGRPLTLLLILLGGLLLNATPCVLPLIPVNLLLIGVTASLPRSRRVLLASAYALGITAAYGALGLLSARTGTVFGTLSASPWPRLALAFLLLLLGLAMLDLLHLDLARFRPASPRPSSSAASPLPRRLLHALLLGALSAVLAGSCIAPVLLAVLALSASLAAAGDPLAPLLPFLLGLGMALPWPLLAAGLPCPRPGPWMDRVKRIFAVLLLLAALAFALSAIPRLRPASDSPFPVYDLSDPAAAEALRARMEEAHRDASPVLLSFSASWCAVCHRMDATTYRDPAVLAALASCTPLRVRADDPASPHAAPLLQQYAVPGFPALRLLPP